MLEMPHLTKRLASPMAVVGIGSTRAVPLDLMHLRTDLGVTMLLPWADVLTSA